MDRNPNLQYTEHFSSEQETTFSPGLEKLKNEHGPLLIEIERLIQEIGLFEGDVEQWKKMIDRYHEFVANLEQHSEKEENTLFRILKGYIGTTSGPIEIMEEEHEEISSNLSSFLTSINELQDVPSGEELSEPLEYLEQAFEVMQQHFFKEEHAIYPMAEQMLSNEEKEEVYRMA